MSLRVLALGSSGGGGDWPPLAAVISELIARGHAVSCLGDEALVRAAAGTRLEIEAVPRERDLPYYMQAWEEESKRDPAAPLPIPRWTEDLLPLALEHARRVRPEVLICQDFTLRLASALRRELGVPVGLVHGTFYTGRDAKRRVQEDYTAQMIEAMRGRRTGLFDGDPPDLTLIASDARFDPPPDAPPQNNHWVGPLLWEPAAAVPEYLSAPGDPWALVTLSSHRQPGELALGRAALDALAPFPVRTLLTLGDVSLHDEIGALPANARVERFVPHKAVLERAALCVSHAGHGIVGKCMHYGVPMVLVPWDRDQPGVAGRAEALGIARVVRREKLSAEALGAAIRAALADDAMRARCAEHGARLRTSDASATACALIEALGRATKPNASPCSGT